MGCPVMSGSGTFAVDPLGSIFLGLGLLWIRFVAAHPTDADRIGIRGIWRPIKTLNLTVLISCFHVRADWCMCNLFTFTCTFDNSKLINYFKKLHLRQKYIHCKILSDFYSNTIP